MINPNPLILLGLVVNGIVNASNLFGDALGRRSEFDRRENHPLKSFKDSLKGILGVKPRR